MDKAWISGIPSDKQDCYKLVTGTENKNVSLAKEFKDCLEG